MTYNFFKIARQLNYFTAMKDVRIAQGENGSIIGLFFILFLSPLSTFVIHAIYYFLIGSEWGVPVPQAKEMASKDIFTIVSIFVFIVLYFFLRRRLVAYYLYIYPSVAIFSTILSYSYFYLSQMLRGIELVGLTYEILPRLDLFVSITIFVLLFFVPII